MKKIIPILLWLAPWMIVAQSVTNSPSVVRSSLSPVGGSSVSNGKYLVASGGEMVNREQPGGTGKISEGFITPDMIAFLGVESYGELEGVTVFPNPVSYYLELTLPAGSNYEIRMFDLAGKQVVSIDSAESRAKIDVHDLPAGMYVLVVTDRTNQRYATFKIEKN